MNKLILSASILLGLASAQISTTPLFGLGSWSDYTPGISGWLDVSVMYVADVSYLTNLNVGTGSPNNPNEANLYNNNYQVEIIAGLQYGVQLTFFSFYQAQFFVWINLVDLLINNYVTWVMPTSIISQGAHFVPDIQVAINYNLAFGHIVTQAIYNANVLNFGQISLTNSFLNLITNPMTTLA